MPAPPSFGIRSAWARRRRRVHRPGARARGTSDSKYVQRSTKRIFCGVAASRTSILWKRIGRACIVGKPAKGLRRIDWEGMEVLADGRW